jgi:hypothetical protein
LTLALNIRFVHLVNKQFIILQTFLAETSLPEHRNIGRRTVKNKQRNENMDPELEAYQDN